MKRVIGNATLYCGDSLQILPTLGPIDALVTDPPYGMSFQSNHRKDKHKAIANDGDERLLLWACGVAVEHSAYIFARWDNLLSVPKPKSLITWVKNNWSMGDLEHEHGRQTEVAFFYPGRDHDFPDGRPADVVRASRTGNEIHPTEKPVSLMTQVVKWTRGVVVDPFMGAGSTGLACAELGRSFIGVEMDRGYFETACERIAVAQSQTKIFFTPKRDIPPMDQVALL